MRLSQRGATTRISWSVAATLACSLLWVDFSSYSFTQACNEYAMVQNGSTHLCTDLFLPLWTPRFYRTCHSNSLGRPSHSPGNSGRLIHMKASLLLSLKRIQGNFGCLSFNECMQSASGIELCIQNAIACSGVVYHYGKYRSSLPCSQLLSALLLGQIIAWIAALIGLHMQEVLCPPRGI